MSYRERCMAGAFRKILSHFGFFKEEDAGARTLPVVTVDGGDAASTVDRSTAAVAMTGAGAGASSAAGRRGGSRVVPQNVDVVIDEHGFHRAAGCDAAAAAGTKDAAKLPTGFRVRVSVPNQKEPYAPVVIECSPGAGGVQGLRWYLEKLMVDEDGDVAQEFLAEVVSRARNPVCGGADILKALPSFELKIQTKPAKLRGPACTLDGNVHQSIEPYTGVYGS